MADIKLIIKIPEGLKNDFESEQWTALSCMEMKNALMNGTPLPKGHGGLVYMSEVIVKLMQYYDGNKTIGQCLDEVHTVIEADGGDTETWNGYHGQVTAPKGTFKRIYADADGGDAECK